MKVFLTGGTGFIGQRLTQTLIQRGWKVTVLVRNPESVEAIQWFANQLHRQSAGVHAEGTSTQGA